MFHPMQAESYHTNIYKWTIFPRKKLELLPSPEFFWHYYTQYNNNNDVIIIILIQITGGILGMPGWAASSQGSLSAGYRLCSQGLTQHLSPAAFMQGLGQQLPYIQQTLKHGRRPLPFSAQQPGDKGECQPLHPFTLPGLPPSHSTATRLQDTWPTPLLLQGWATLACCAWNLLHSQDLEAEALL